MNAPSCPDWRSGSPAGGPKARGIPPSGTCAHGPIPLTPPGHAGGGARVTGDPVPGRFVPDVPMPRESNSHGLPGRERPFLVQPRAFRTILPGAYGRAASVRQLRHGA